MLTLCRWKLPHEEVVYENERVRRKATWKDEGDHDDDSNDDDDEDDDANDRENDAVDSDEEDRNSDVVQSENTRNEKAEVMFEK